MAADSLLNLNISGRRYSITKETARTIRGSLFDLLSSFGSGSEAIRGVHFRPEYNEYFIERSPMMFDIILQYLYTGHLVYPSMICEAAIGEELTFWRLNDSISSAPCCRPLRNEHGRENFTKVTNGKLDRREITLKRDRTKIKNKLHPLWRICEDPESSKKALVFNLICILSIIVSIGNLVMGTVPSFHHCDNSSSFLSSKYTNGQNPSYPENKSNTNTLMNPSFISEEDQANWTEAIPVYKVRTKRLGEKFSQACDGGFIFDIIELTCVLWFTIEFLLRAISCPDKVTFIKSPLNIIDFLAIFPFYLEIGIWSSGLITDLDRSSSVSSVLLMLRVMRVLRAFRVLRLARYFDSLQIMGKTLWESRRDMGLLIMFLAVGVLIFSTLLYYIEKDVEGTDYTSIPAAFWWAIVTMTTTGYGDVTPRTPLGKVVAGVACIAGVLIFAFPVSILVEHFRMSYADRRKIVVSKEPMDSSTALENLETSVSTGYRDQSLERCEQRLIE